MKRLKVEVFENMMGEWTASNGLLSAFGKTEKEALARFKHYQKYGTFD